MARLGSEKRPLVLRVASPDRAEEVTALCEEHGAKYVIGVEPGRPEDTSDLERFLNPPAIAHRGPKVGRNDPCPCGNGKKHKKCCGRLD